MLPLSPDLASAVFHHVVNQVRAGAIFQGQGQIRGLLNPESWVVDLMETTESGRPRWRRQRGGSTGF